MQDKGFARKGCVIYSRQEKEIGVVSSGTYSPALNSFIGMAYVDSDFSLPKTDIKIGIRNKLYRAEVVKLPFVDSRVKTSVIG